MMLDAFFESYYRLRPVNATFTGVHDHDHRLPDWSPDGLASAVDEMRALRTSLDAAAEPAATLHDVGERDRQLAMAFLDVQIAEHESGHFQRGNPSLAVGEAIFGVIALMTRPFAPVAERADAADRAPDGDARRSSTAPGGRSTAACPTNGALKCLRECDGADRLLARRHPRAGSRVEAIDDSARHRLIARGRSRPARPSSSFQVAGSRTTRRPRRRIDTPCGPDLLGPAARRAATGASGRAPTLAADAAAGARRSARTAATRALRAIAPGGWPEVQQRLTDGAPGARRLSARLSTRAGMPAASARRACDLVTWPAYPIRYVPIPVHTRDAAPFLYYLFYRSPAPFDRLPIHDYVVTPIDAAHAAPTNSCGGCAPPTRA